MMDMQNRSFQVGDQVIHWVYGLGEIVRLEEKKLSGRSGRYYVVQIRDLTIWVPLTESGEHCLRFPTPAEDFQKLFRLLASPGEPLAKDRYMRKNQLAELMKDGTLESTCRVVRDLVTYKRGHRINENDNILLERARNFLLSEWSLALSVPILQAERELKDLLEESVI